MIRREIDAELINRISNMAGVREFICYKQGTMDWSPAFGFEDAIIVLSDGAGACGVFEQSADRAYKVHTLFGPDVRGRKAIEAAAEMLNYMRRYADVIWGMTPVSNCKARWFNRQLGAMPKRREYLDDVEGEVEVFELRLN